MYKKSISLILSVLLFISVAIPFMAFAKNSVNVFDGENTRVYNISSDNITKTLQEAFSYCDSHSDKKYTVSVPMGEYTVSSPITLCDNATLDLTDNVVLVNGKNNTNIFIGKRNVKKYNGTTNFKILGGTLTYSDDYAGSGCQIRIAHGKHITFEKTVFQNNYNSHNVEIAACYDVSFESCTFKNGKGNFIGNSGEALQIDILEKTKHFKDMPDYDVTMNKKITVNNCTFSNVLRGIGTSSAFAGIYQKNIKITNCRFNNIKSAAINCLNFIDSTFSNNRITDCGEGIKYSLMMSDANLQKMNYIEGEGSPISDCNTVISSNDISVIKTKDVSSSFGIYVFGNNITKDKNVSFKTGNYYVGNLKIKNNKIKTENFGISMYDVSNSVISGNDISGNAKSYGIRLDSDSKSNKIYNNTVRKFEHGIYLVSGNNNILKSNTLKDNRWGIYFSSGITAYTHYNKFASNTSNGYSAGEKKSYVFSNLAVPELSLSKNNKGVIVEWKAVKKAQYYQIYRSSSKNGTYEKTATIKSTKLKYKDTNVKKGRKYYYKVRAKRKINNIYNYSSYSDIKSIKI
ncbi:MAG: right-handed parallel beta-helix repeat-containing protein [Eubacterium sp.]|nr:right-handed parallel beta-helix repeat-containing protein [Eubacterium sp.]